VPKWGSVFARLWPSANEPVREGAPTGLARSGAREANRAEERDRVEGDAPGFWSERSGEGGRAKPAPGEANVGECDVPGEEKAPAR